MDDSTICQQLRTCPRDLATFLPPEIWRKIIAFTVRSSLGSRIDLEDAFEASLDIIDEFANAGLLSDRRSLALVSSSWRFAVTEISAESLIIRSGKTLAAVVEVFENSKTQKNRTGRHLGEITRRIHVREFFDWKHDNTYNAQLIRLLKCTPNLLVYTHDDFWMIPEPAIIAQEVLETLIIHCGRSLQRVGWKTIGPLLDYQNIVKLCHASPDLVTLRLESGSFLSNPSGHHSTSLLYLPKLKTLSLISILNRMPMTSTLWDQFIQHISLDSQQLPSLERFDCNRFPPNVLPFFRIHGHKIRQLQASQCPENNIAGAIELCPKLESLVIDECRESTVPLSAHPTLKRICILSDRTRISFEALDFLLRSIERMDAPCLEKVQINTDALCITIDYRLHSWWGRLYVRGICLVDEVGASYENHPVLNYDDYDSGLDEEVFE